MIISDIDNDGSYFHVAVERNAEKQSEIAVGGTESPYLADCHMEYCRPGMTVDEAEEWALTAMMCAAVREKATG
jgi:20S proteasome alpha/beta subunit